MLKSVEAGVLRVAYEEHGETAASPVVLLHGFPGVLAPRARWRERVVAYGRCGIGFLGARCLRMADDVRGPEARRGATAARGG